MRPRYLTGLMLLAWLPAWAQDFASQSENETVRQVSTTQAHLQGVGPQAAPTQMKTHTMLRLMGKMLSDNVKGLRVDLDPTPFANDANLPLQDQSLLRLNRRAEICYDNYRLGLTKGGMVMRYELTF